MIKLVSTKYAFVYTFTTAEYENVNSFIGEFSKRTHYQIDMLDVSHLDLKETNMGIYITAKNLVWVFFDEELLSSEHRHIRIDELFRSKMKKYMVTNKRLLNTLFTEDFSDNLLEISIDRNDYYEILPNNLYYGSQLNYSSEYESIINEDDIEIMSFKLQPQYSNFTITFFNENLIEFSECTDVPEMKRHISDLSALINKTLEG
ncbi:hypothetical protein P0100_22710 [Yersinia pestis]|nr:hypothetical protein [Yersinia pestis]